MDTRRWHRKGADAALTAALAAALAACGGGGGGTPAPAPAPPAQGLALSGTAATGVALAGRPVDARCSTGSGSTTTGTDGSYSVTIAGAALPCAMRVTLADNTVLHGLATSGGGSGTSTSARANLTPATQLVVAQLAGLDPAAYYAAFDGSAAAAATPARLALAEAAVVAALKDGGIDLTPAGDLLAGALTSGATPGSGNAYDSALDALRRALAASGSTLAALTATMAGSSLDVLAGGTPASGSAALPPAQLLRAAAANCAALRSGSYRVLSPAEGATLAAKTGLLGVNVDASNAAAPRITYTDGSTGTWVANGPCRYLDNAGRDDIVVSPAGLLAVRYTNDGGQTYRVGVGFPAQSHTLAELAGTWNNLSLSTTATPGTYGATSARFTIDAGGSLGPTALFCANANWSLRLADCPFAVPGIAFRANADGGFDAVDMPGGGVGGRLFLYRAGNGDLMAVGADADGSFHFATHERHNSLPAVGTVSTSWSLFLNAQGRSTSPVGATTNTIVSVDTAAQSWVRSQANVGSPVTHPETLYANNPRDGFSLRSGGAAAGSDGSTVNVNEFTALGLRGMGMSVVVLPGPQLFLLAPSQP
ncbi:MAG: hypothetical protein KGJ24_06260 [Burkholderiales bacterium]|nr:hypothetical protein [Burkholderiales bacterium]